MKFNLSIGNGYLFSHLKIVINSLFIILFLILAEFLKKMKKFLKKGLTNFKKCNIIYL